MCMRAPRSDVQALTIEIACALTVTTENGNDWVARNGPESIYAVVANILSKVLKFY